MATPERVAPMAHTEAAETENSVHPLRAKLWEALITADVEKEYIPDRERQQVVFDRLKWDAFTRELGGGGTSEGDGRRLRGQLFEMLINADPAFGERTPLEKELLALAHNPDAFGLGKELGYHRNPDMAFLLIEKDDGVEITGIGESKLGLLNERSFHQLSETGFARGVNALVEVVNNLPDPMRHGLVELAGAKALLGPDAPLLRVSSEFTQMLVIPANRKPEWSSTLINRREFTIDGRNRFRELLNDTQRVMIHRAAFSTAEVGALVHAIQDGARPARSAPARYRA